MRRGAHGRPGGSGQRPDDHASRGEPPAEPHAQPDDGGAEPNEDDGEPLSVQVDGGRGEPTRVYVLTRSRGGLVEVREFRAGCAALEYTASADELLALFERAHRERRRMSESVYGIRLWLDGAG